MKHVQRRHFFVRDMVESFEIEVPFVPTKDNIADLPSRGGYSLPSALDAKWLGPVVAQIDELRQANVQQECISLSS